MNPERSLLGVTTLCLIIAESTRPGGLVLLLTWTLLHIEMWVQADLRRKRSK
jgi:hypothetical protein